MTLATLQKSLADILAGIATSEATLYPASPKDRNDLTREAELWLS